MRILGLDITRPKRSTGEREALTPLYGPNLWMNLFNSNGVVLESNPGNWQKNLILERTTLLTFSAVYCCVTGIASDIGKLRIKLTQEDGDGVYTEITANNPRLAVLQKPNHFQTRQKFIEQWVLSKLLAGNAYVLKVRDDKRGIVTSMYCLDPQRVTPLIAENGDLYYQLRQDYLHQIPADEGVIVPASEMIHDSMPGIFHPLIGTSPLYACMNSVQQGNSIQSNSSNFFANRSMPGGMLTAPGKISDATAARLKALFETNFSGANAGKLFVGGDGLVYSPLAMTAEQSLLVEQLKWSVSDVARAFHYPEFKMGGPLPPYQANMQALTLSYYTDCLQTLIESIEAHLDEGIEVPSDQCTELDTDNLLRMDNQGQAEVAHKLVSAGVMSPDDGRRKFNLPPVPGGKSPYLQQQNFSLEALAKRDALPDPFVKATSQLPTSDVVPGQPNVDPKAVDQSVPKPVVPTGTGREMSEEELEAQIELGLGRELAPV